MKYCGKIGFAKTVETSKGISEETITEKTYFGDVIKYSHRFKDDKVNSDFILTNEVSVIADRFARENLGHMRYVTFMGEKWTISTASIEYPRIIISLGGLYNENETPVTD